MSYCAEIGIIGGSGFYDPEMFENRKEIKVHTPYGAPSDVITIGEFKGIKVAFLPRHGRRHSIPPHLINYKANIWAMMDLGVKRIIAPSAVGSLKEEIKPGDIVIPDQFIDFTKKRDYSFYNGAIVGHFSLADPFCPELNKICIETLKKLGLRYHHPATYICIEGPRFSTRAESRLFKSWGADIIGMTLVPEVILARECGICYTTIATVTDYDVWAEKPVTAEEVVKTLNQNVEKVKKLLMELIPRIPKERKCQCEKSSEGALI
ncbi:MAG: S-methyl-5'-thioadenosine phosphorylase [Candidatus Verstraetearchaeota archaeon]|jgi:5'-methylthioadenosine phosphorylase|nr:S-methyl-5'-thioadenosine phosphorylase [Candidatus Verstraetearchaeota archaeon]